MKKELVLSKLEELGFELVEVGEHGYAFEFEKLTILYMPDDDEYFLRFAVPGIFDVTDENKDDVLDVVNETNMAIKYSKTCVFGDDVWIFYEYRIFDDEHLEEILEHVMRLLQVTYYLFHRKVEGDDTLPGEVDDEMENNENENKEDE